LERKKKILFIINPISGVGRQRTVVKAIRRNLDLSLFEYNISYTKYPHHAIEIAKEAVSNGFHIVVAVGGDGSANEVAQGIIKSNTVMGIIPVGSGNGLARHLKIPFNIAKAIDVINKLKTEKIDTARINGKLFISIAGIGFDALIAEKFALGKRRGFWSYFKKTILEYFKYSPLEYTINIDQKQIKRDALLISFANSSQFGYNASISPTASISDGCVDLCIVNKMSAFRAAILAHKLFLKNIDSSKYIEVFKVTEAFISCKEPASSHIDGDPGERLTEIHINIQPKTLSIIVP